MLLLSNKLLSISCFFKPPVTHSIQAVMCSSINMCYSAFSAHYHCFNSGSFSNIRNERAHILVRYKAARGNSCCSFFNHSSSENRFLKIHQPNNHNFSEVKRDYRRWTKTRLPTELRHFLQTMNKKIDFGIIFDIDGVLGRGSVPFAASKRMMRLLSDNDGKVQVPIAFCTNSSGTLKDKAVCISKWLDTEVRPQQVIAAHSPLSVFTEFHHKRVLVVGQGKLHEMAEELGFTKIVTIDEVKEAFPLLDIVDHGNRNYIAKNRITRSQSRDEFEPIEAIILFGEPTKWETHLQLLIDLMVTGGHPSFVPDKGIVDSDFPIIACNMDLVFMAEACMPRFGHGAFLVCLESLYKKITGRDLQYTALVGKPSEITYRYAEHCITREAVKIGIELPIRTLYMVGDNPEVDVFGSNLYNRYIAQCMVNENAGLSHASREVPSSYKFTSQTATKCNSILVDTGVYNSKLGKIEDQEYDVYHHGHRDFETNQHLRIPTTYCTDVYEAVSAIIEQEMGSMDLLNNNEPNK
ncbi:haloacid dehalogenase-like hydrolase domain-containing 5 isoform X2 [Watersipora subatra]|uniref:haloacid dehalogenase-like hydrolase domain-containing 5 isoform X2 n=1 Tax=Watersipora subatra TaxID=2589382 RepID=UPI00355B236D